MTSKKIEVLVDSTASHQIVNYRIDRELLDNYEPFLTPKLVKLPFSVESKSVEQRKLLIYLRTENVSTFLQLQNVQYVPSLITKSNKIEMKINISCSKIIRRNNVRKVKRKLSVNELEHRK